MTRLFYLISLFVLLLGRPVWAESAGQDPTQEAATRYARGLSFYDQEDFSLALIEFDRAYQLVPDYRVLYNVGQVSIQLSKFARARTALREYLERGGDLIAEQRKIEVLADLKMLEERTAFLTVLVDVEGAEVLVDDVPQGHSPLAAPLLLDAGQHRVTVAKSGYSELRRHLTLAGADSVQLDFALEPIASEKPVVIIQKAQDEKLPTAALPSSTPAQRKPAVSPWVIAGWSTTAALATASATLGILGMSSAKKARDLEDQPSPSSAQYSTYTRQAEGRLLAADVLGIGAVVSGGASVYLTLSSREKRTANKLSVDTALRLSWPHVSLEGAF